MKNVFKQLIIDFQTQTIPQPTPRDMRPLKLTSGLKKAFVLVGMRRSGKTWTLYQQIHELLSQGVDRKKIIYINFEDDRLLGLKIKDLQLLLDGYFELFPQFKKGPPHFFFNGLHEIAGWEKFIRRLLDTEKCANLSNRFFR